MSGDLRAKHVDERFEGRRNQVHVSKTTMYQEKSTVISRTNIIHLMKMEGTTRLKCRCPKKNFDFISVTRK